MVSANLRVSANTGMISHENLAISVRDAHESDSRFTFQALVKVKVTHGPLQSPHKNSSPTLLHSTDRRT
jgi:hypothetical protein